MPRVPRYINSYYKPFSWRVYCAKKVSLSCFAVTTALASVHGYNVYEIGKHINECQSTVLIKTNKVDAKGKIIYQKQMFTCSETKLERLKKAKTFSWWGFGENALLGFGSLFFAIAKVSPEKPVNRK